MSTDKTIYAYAVLTKLIFSRNYSMTELNKKGLSMSQMFALAKLDECGMMNLTSIAKGIQVTNQAMTGITNKLVEEGYIDRVYSPKNRRQILVKLTDKGKEFMTEYYDAVYDAFGEMFAQCTPEEINTLNRASKDIIRILSHTDHEYGMQYQQEIEDVLKEQK